MTPAQLNILRTIAKFQPILKSDLYKLPIPNQCIQVYLWSLKQRGYVSYDRRKGPVWLTMKGRQVIDEQA